MTILQVVDAEGKRVLDENGRQVFQVGEDGRHTGARGNVFDLRKLTGRALHWRYGLVAIVETGEVVRRDEMAVD